MILPTVRRLTFDNLLEPLFVTLGIFQFIYFIYSQFHFWRLVLPILVSAILDVIKVVLPYVMLVVGHVRIIDNEAALVILIMC